MKRLSAPILCALLGSISFSTARTHDDDNDIYDSCQAKKSGVTRNTDFPELTLNETRPGKMTGDIVGYHINQMGGDFYTERFSINLKSKQSIKIKASVSGDGRKVGLAILDTDKKKIKATQITDTNATLYVDETNVDGKYTVIIVSNFRGDFDLLVADNNKSPEDQIKSLENEIKELKKTLEQKESELAELQKKKK